MALSRGALLAIGLRDELEVPTQRVDILDVIRRIGVRVHLVPNGDSDRDLDGMYLRQDGESFIYVNTAKAPRRQRLTAAHELGHHLLVDDDIKDYEVLDWDSHQTAAEETEAFNFARELLIDRRWTRENCRTLDPIGAIEQVVLRFDVSPEVAAVQLCEIGLIRTTDKSAFLERQRDAQTRVRFGTPQAPGRQTEIEPTFLHRLEALETRGILSRVRAQELRRHARMLPPQVNRTRISLLMRP